MGFCFCRTAIVLFLFVFCQNIISSQSEAKLRQANIVKNTPVKKRKLVKILSIDGGGVKGIIPLKILERIEKKLKTSDLSKSFDVLAGTSTGGLIVLMLSSTNGVTKQSYKAADVVNIYRDLSHEVFSPSLWRQVKTGWGWWGPKYCSHSLEKLLYRYFQDQELSSLEADVLVPSYELERNTTVVFQSLEAKLFSTKNFKLRDVARATSAAPTFFTPANVTNVEGTRHFVFADGGISSNNPTLVALIHAIKRFGPENDFFILSLGTGKTEDEEIISSADSIRTSGMLGWARRLFSLLMEAPSQIEDAELLELFDGIAQKSYVRLNPLIGSEHIRMDCASKENIAVLELYAEKLIDENEKLIEKVVTILNQDQ